ncbi:MAG TPA: NUDIX hydrolase [Candidatus Binatia bacterium]|nr:NUDIX hydrolase [Candidatus Binatia bacterium]
MPEFIRKVSHELYRNPWCILEAHEIIHPNGTPGEHVLVRVPVAAATVVVDGSDVLLTRQHRFAIERSVLEITKGGTHDAETPLECAQRETREELGVLARLWEPMGIVYEIPSIVSNPVHLFLAREIEHVPQDMEPVETIDVERFSFAAALHAVVEGRINDAVTTAALLRAAVRLGYATLTPAASASRSRDARADRARD